MELATIETRLTGGDANKPVTRKELVWALRRITELFDVTDTDHAQVVASVTTVNNSVSTVRDTVALSLTLTLVANSQALPAAAAVREWFRVTGDPALYVGNGAGQPLTKLTPAVLPG